MHCAGWLSTHPSRFASRACPSACFPSWIAALFSSASPCSARLMLSNTASVRRNTSQLSHPSLCSQILYRKAHQTSSALKVYHAVKTLIKPCTSALSCIAWQDRGGGPVALIGYTKTATTSEMKLPATIPLMRDTITSRSPARCKVCLVVLKACLLVK